jgi:hypothetical protein
MVAERFSATIVVLRARIMRGLDRWIDVVPFQPLVPFVYSML